MEPDYTFDGSATPAILTLPVAYSLVTGEMMLSIISSQTGNHLRNIRFTLPHCTGKFNYAFKQSLAPFSCLRFMDWANTNATNQVNWVDRNKPGFSIAQKGMYPWEDLFDLCNELGRDCWLNIPDTATADYIQNLARLADERLDPGLAIYAELSNELWNFSFPQATRLQTLAAAAGQSGNLWGFMGSRQGWATNLFYDSLSKARTCYRVCAGQVGYLAVTQQMMGGFTANSYTFDLVVGAPYFGTDADLTAAATLYATDPKTAVANVLAGCATQITTVLGYVTATMAAMTTANPSTKFAHVRVRPGP